MEPASRAPAGMGLAGQEARHPLFFLFKFPPGDSTKPPGPEARMPGEGSVPNLQAEGGITLLEHKVPDVQGPIHLSGEENCWPHRAPGAISKVGHVVPVGSRVPPVRDAVGRAERLLSHGSPPPALPGSRVSLLGRKFFLVSDCQPCRPHAPTAPCVYVTGLWIWPFLGAGHWCFSTANSRERACVAGSGPGPPALGLTEWSQRNDVLRKVHDIEIRRELYFLLVSI